MILVREQVDVLEILYNPDLSWTVFFARSVKDMCTQIVHDKPLKVSDTSELRCDHSLARRKEEAN